MRAVSKDDNGPEHLAMTLSGPEHEETLSKANDPCFEITKLVKTPASGR